MNKTNLLRVADAIEKHEIEGLGFNMSFWVENASRDLDLSGHGCGTVACIGGTAEVLRLGDVKAASASWQGEENAAEWLGLSPSQANILFFSMPSGIWFQHVQPAQAVATLRYAAEFDDIDWDAAQEWAASKSEAV